MGCAPGYLTLKDGDSEEVYAVTFAGLIPKASRAARQRLLSLGYDCPKDTTRCTRRAAQLPVRARSRRHRQADDKTKDELVKAYGC